MIKSGSRASTASLRRACAAGRRGAAVRGAVDATQQHAALVGEILEPLLKAWLLECICLGGLDCEAVTKGLRKVTIYLAGARSDVRGVASTV